MRKSFIFGFFALVTVLALLPGSTLAQETETVETAEIVVTTTSRTNTSSQDRLYINFIEDAMVVDEQWWEGWLQYDDADVVKRTILFGRAAFQPWDDVEIGASIGFGNTDNSNGFNEGTGATDLNLWGKYFWNLDNDRTELTAGGIVTIPSGDDSVGLGFDSWALKGFGAVRYRLKPAVITGTVGLQFNSSGRTLDEPTMDGEIAYSLGVGVIAPWSESFSWVGELSWKSERFDGAKNDAQLLGGINLRLSSRGLLRPALAFGLQDGASDLSILVGYAYSF
jgi:hypothetical protein